MKEDWSHICEGVRELVRELNEDHGIITTDSGDGSNWVAGMGGALPYKHVQGPVPKGESVKEFCARLVEIYPDADIEISYKLPGGGFFTLVPDGYPDNLIELLDKPLYVAEKYKSALEEIAAKSGVATNILHEESNLLADIYLLATKTLKEDR